MDRLFNLPIRVEAQSSYTEEFAKLNTEDIIGQVSRAKIRGMKPYELTVIKEKPVVVFVLPEVLA